MILTIDNQEYMFLDYNTKGLGIENYAQTSGNVHIAENVLTQQKVLIKSMLGVWNNDTPVSYYNAIILEEAQLLAQMDHPDIIKVIGMGTMGSKEGNLTLFSYVIEYFEGVSLWNYWHNRETIMTLDEIIALFEEIKKVVTYVQAKGFEVLPDHIYVDKNRRIKLLVISKRQATINYCQGLGAMIWATITGKITPSQLY